MTNSVINSARNIVERANRDSSDRSSSRVHGVVSELQEMGATEDYISDVLD